MHVDFLNGKKVLLFGLGKLGGGVATTNFLLSQNIKSLIITDLKTKNELKDSINQIKKSKKVKFFLGKQIRKHFEESDIIVLNPAINPFENKWVKIAQKKENK